MGSLDKSFIRIPGFDGAVRAIVNHPDGGIIVGGDFTNYNGITRQRIAKLKIDGSLDTKFDPAGGFNGFVFSLVMHPDGGVIVGGLFTTYKGTPRQSIAKLNGKTAALNTAFDSAVGFNGPLTSLAMHPDGGVIVGGLFTSYKATMRLRIAKLDGTTAALDTTFDSSSGFNSSLTSLAMHPDGGVIVSGFFTLYIGTPRPYIAKLNGTTAALDTTFDTAGGFDQFVSFLGIHPDGGVIAGGQFDLYKGIPRDRIAKLNGTTAALDTTFDSASGFGGDEVYFLTVQPDGKIVVGGNFTTYKGIARVFIARLNGTSAALDENFNAGSSSGSFVLSIAYQPNGKIVAGGTFATYQGSPTENIARFYGSPLEPATGERFGVEQLANVNDLKAENSFVIPIRDLPAQKSGSICLSAAGILIRKQDGSVGTIALT